jgi:periplasmic divalent cation tolerance protein
MKKFSNYRIVFVTTDSKESAKEIASAIITDKLAACCSIIDGVESVYEWEGKIEESKEFILMIKTKEEKLALLEKRIIELHPYDVPEFITTNIENGSESYLKCLDSSLQE